MKLCFADAFFFFAWWNRHDRAHAKTIEFLRAFDGRLLTTRWVLMEVADGLASTPARVRVRAFFEDLASDPFFEIVEPSTELERQGLLLYDGRPDKAWSLTDCISFVVMREHQVTDALTGDRHFEQAGFVALLK